MQRIRKIKNHLKSFSLQLKDFRLQNQRGNYHFGSHAQRHRTALAHVNEFDVETGISATVLDFSKRRNKDNEEAHFPEYYDVSMIAYLIKLFRSKEVMNLVQDVPQRV